VRSGGWGPKIDRNLKKKGGIWSSPKSEEEIFVPTERGEGDIRWGEKGLEA